MARTLRIQYPGAIYHVMNRGDRREDIFEDDMQAPIDTLIDNTWTPKVARAAG